MAQNGSAQQASVAKLVLAFGGGAVLLVLLATGLVEILLFIDPSKITKDNMDGYLLAKGVLDNVFGATLPLVGVWVGAVISYYFGKANFDSATESVHKAYQIANDKSEQLKARRVSEFMTLVDDKSLVISDDLTISQAIETVDEYNKKNPSTHRLPIVANGTKKAIAYLELDELQIAKTKDGETKISSYIKDIKELAVSRFGIIGEQETMEDASLGLSKPGVCILFVTKGGKSSDDLSGIVTSKDIARCLSSK